MLISEKSRMVTYLFLSCYVNEYPYPHHIKKIRELLGTDYFSHMLDQATLTQTHNHNVKTSQSNHMNGHLNI